MKEFLKNKKNIILVTAVVILIIVVIVVSSVGFDKAKTILLNGERVIKETSTPRSIEHVTIVDGRSAVSTGENIPIAGLEKTLIEGGRTPKGGYEIANPDALIWAPDAKLVYIRSLGTVTTDGVSSGWEVVFGSKIQKKGYMIAVVGGVIVQKNEIILTSFGYDLPRDWYDAGEAIKSIRTLPQFSDTTISGLNFYYNEDGKRWGYAIVSSSGTVSVPVR